MRRLPNSAPASVRRLLGWLESAEVAALPSRDVPGASPTELKRLAALGGLGRGLAPRAVRNWPPALRHWADTAPRIDPVVLQAVSADLSQGVTPDILATTYEWVMSGPNRRRLGTFFTPAPLSQYMLHLASGHVTDPAHIVDPGAGVGAFTEAALLHWPKTRVSAVDVNTVTLGLLAARVAHRGDGTSRRLRTIKKDYLDWLEQDWPDLRGQRLIIGNPPYTRHQHMGASSKARAGKAAGPLVQSGLAGLSAYFLAASLLALGPRDSLCLLLPASWCETRYGRETREWLWSQHHRAVDVQLFPSRLEIFPGTQVTAMILLVGPILEEGQPFRVSQLDFDGERVSAVSTRTLKRSNLCPPTFAATSREPLRVGLSPSTPLGAHARVRRGVATGASDFFFLTDDKIVSLGLPAEALHPGLVKSSHVQGLDLTTDEHEAMAKAGRPRWLLNLSGEAALVASSAELQEYLRSGEHRGLHTRYLTRARKPWYAVEEVKPPDIFLTPMARHGHRIIENTLGALGSNNLYGIYLDPTAPWTRTELADWLRSSDGQASISALGRHYQGGTIKVEPKALRQLLVPASPGGAVLF